MFKNILLAVDLDKEKDHQKAVDAVLKLVNEDTCIYIASVIPVLDGGGFMSSFLPASFEDQLIDSAKKELHNFSKKFFVGQTNIKHLVVHGKIYEKIVELTEKLDIDLVITLAKNPKDKNSPSFGPNIARIARNTFCSVLIVR